MPFPGKDYNQHDKEPNDDCFRCSLAYILDYHPNRVPYIDPSNDNLAWWERYEVWCIERTGYDFAYDYDPNPQTIEGLWIAIVPYLNGSRTGSHAIVMDGAKFEYDPGHARTRKPQRFELGVKLVPRAPRINYG